MNTTGVHTAAPRLASKLLAVVASFAVANVASCSSGGESETADSASSSSDPDPASTSPSADYPLDATLRLDQVQVLGSHNSYHVQAEPDLFAAMTAAAPDLTATLEYSHAPLTEQLDRYGIRQMELDVFADPEGGRYAEPAALPILGRDPPSDPDWREPGFTVLHVQDVDFGTRCVLFVTCLREIKDWSDAHPGHVPILVLVEAKDEVITLEAPLEWTVPLPIGAEELDALDAEIRSVFDDDDLITPDLVRGDHATLGESVASDGWPLLGEVRGRVVFALNSSGQRDVYVADHPSLEGRVMFTNSEPGLEDSAFTNRDDPVEEADAIAASLAANMLVRTRADADTYDARENDTARRDAAFASGAQLVSTDYEVANPDFGPYVVAIPGGTVARCNPVTAPPECRPEDVENP